jgi:hypothetical protein
MSDFDEREIKHKCRSGVAKVRLRVSPPGNPRILQKFDQMPVCKQLRLAGLRIRENTEVCSSFQPQIIRLAGVILRGIEIRLAGVCSRVPLMCGPNGLALLSGAPNAAPALLPVNCDSPSA